ncbi:MAG: hypothetical protein GXO26_05225, partial [Crenarchaeota archaeon]|nr:hypothetical protein [Thermoproteota archaeon]
MSIRYEQFILAKIWALLHDPPHKGLIVGESSETNHETLAKEALRRFLGQSIPEIVEKIVSRADKFAASVEREISIYIKDFKNIRSRYINILNMFDTRYKAYKEETLKEAREKGHEWFNKFLENLYKLGEVCRPLPDNVKYLILYTTLEAAWARTGARWVSPADTRYPTHTVFDHVYTTASMVNLFTVNESPTGYLIYFDIPSVQTFIGASRRSLDYWAGSMIISYITLKTFSELIEKIGPDIFISPSMRHNPLLEIELLESMIPKDIGENLRKNIISILSAYWSNLYTGKVPATIVMQPVMPGTVLCILPKIETIEGLKEKLNISEDNTEGIRKYIIDRFYTCWKNIVNKVFDGLLDSSKIPNINKLIKIFED